MQNRDLVPLGPSNLDPIYVIYVFGSMLSCILCESHKNFQKVMKIELVCANSQEMTSDR